MQRINRDETAGKIGKMADELLRAGVVDNEREAVRDLCLHFSPLDVVRHAGQALALARRIRGADA